MTKQHATIFVIGFAIAVVGTGVYLYVTKKDKTSKDLDSDTEIEGAVTKTAKQTRIVDVKNTNTLDVEI